jgi:serine/threonine-protein kinase
MARLSPDGRWLAYVTDESGSRQVMVQPFPGPGPRVQVSTNGGAEPVWSRDGRRIFYRGLRKIVAANIVTDPTFAVVSRDELMDDVFQQAVSPHANYDVAPDGTQLLMLKGVDRQGLIVVHNWADEVRARVRSVGR